MLINSFNLHNQVAGNRLVPATFAIHYSSDSAQMDEFWKMERPTMDQLRRCAMKAFFRCECWCLVLLVLTMVVGASCATQGSALQQSEAAFSAAEEEASAKKADATEAERAAAAAEAAKVVAGKAHAGALMADATSRAKLAEDMVREAEAQKAKACALNPDMCGGTAAAVKFVDIKLADFTSAGATRLNDYPTGWKINFEGGQFVLKGEGLLVSVVLVKPSGFKPGMCYRFTAVKATEITCPGASPASGEVR